MVAYKCVCMRGLAYRRRTELGMGAAMERGHPARTAMEGWDPRQSGQDARAPLPRHLQVTRRAW